jgi:serine/threonine protein kinase
MSPSDPASDPGPQNTGTPASEDSPAIQTPAPAGTAATAAAVGAPSKTDDLLRALKGRYEAKQRGSEFAAEEGIYRELLPKLDSELAGLFELVAPINIGSTATVWKVNDLRLGRPRALKLPRPRQGKLTEIIRIFRGETGKLATLNHQNLVKVYFAGELTLSDYAFPFYVMDFLPDVRDFDEFILARRSQLTTTQILTYFRDALVGLVYLHDAGVVHCDIKPPNLLIAPDTPALVADLGYAKYLRRAPADVAMTEVRFTDKYAHPQLKERMARSSDPDAQRSEIPRSDLSPVYDLFALGRTIQDVLDKLRRAAGVEPPPPFDIYAWRYINIIAKRLLDGQIGHTSDDEVLSDSIPGLQKEFMAEVKYRTADEALTDVEKLLHLYDLEGAVPELTHTWAHTSEYHTQTYR